MKTKVQDGDLEEEERAPIEKAFEHGGTATLGEVQLQPYSPDRVVAAQAMGQKYGFLNAAELGQFKKTKVYPGMVADIAIHIWLRSLPKDAEFEVDQAITDPSQARKKAIEFGNVLEILNTRSKSFWQAWDIFIFAMQAIRNSQLEPQKKTMRKKARPSPLTG